MGQGRKVSPKDVLGVFQTTDRCVPLTMYIKESVVGQLVMANPLREVSSASPFVSILTREAKPSHTITKPCSHMSESSLSKSSDHAPTFAHW